MNKEEATEQKTILNVGYCETTSEWLNRIITELADENKNFVDLSVICAWVLRKCILFWFIFSFVLIVREILKILLSSEYKSKIYRDN